MAKLLPWLQHESFKAEIINNYGPTECTDIAAYYRVKEPMAYLDKPVPLGKPNDNVQLYILNEDKQAVPPGLVGELCISGEGVGAGYLNKEALTQKVFEPNPFAENGNNSLLYRTGDLARVLPDGQLEFIGRKDFQVKIRGLRIELGEVEYALRQQAHVEDALVIAKNETLIAYVTGAESQNEALNKAPWRDQLKEYLPDYMIPSRVMALTTWPLTPNGKIDRKALPAADAELTREYIAPRNELEEKLAAIWAELLGLERVGIRDNFFEIGGHSLLAVRILARMEKEFNVPLRLSMMFTAQTIETVAPVIASKVNPESWSPLVHIKVTKSESSEDSKPPLFLVHPVGGSVLCYHELSNELSTLMKNEQPIYGLQASGFEEGQVVYQNLEEMASVYIEAIKQVQEKGPYYLAGQSLGGTLALEIAQQLQVQGNPVAFLALFDTYLPEHIPESMKSRSQSDLLIEQFGFAMGLDAKKLNDIPEEDQLEYIYNLADEMGVLPSDLNFPQAKRIIEVIFSNARAMIKYRINAYSGNLIHISARSSLEGSPEIKNKDLKSISGWKDVVQGQLTEYEIDGTHESILQAPYVKALAEYLSAELMRSPENNSNA